MRTMYSKLIEVGPCPKTQEGQFVLSGGEQKGEAVTCQWFQESTSRCHEHLEGRLNCNGVCGNKSSRNFCSSNIFPPFPALSPSPFPTITAPTTSSPPTPIPSPLVTSSPTEGNSTCSDLTTLFKAFFKDGSTKNKTCEWTKRKSTGWRCHSVQGVKEACPNTCTNCCVESVEPFQLLKNNKTKTCVWAATSNTEKRCKIPPTRQLCPITCGIC